MQLAKRRDESSLVSTRQARVPALRLAQSSVDGENLAGDEIGRGEEEKHGVRDFFGGSRFLLAEVIARNFT